MQRQTEHCGLALEPFSVLPKPGKDLEFPLLRMIPVFQSWASPSKPTAHAGTVPGLSLPHSGGVSRTPSDISIFLSEQNPCASTAAIAELLVALGSPFVPPEQVEVADWPVARNVDSIRGWLEPRSAAELSLAPERAARSGLYACCPVATAARQAPVLQQASDWCVCVGGGGGGGGSKVNSEKKEQEPCLLVGSATLPNPAFPST